MNQESFRSIYFDSVADLYDDYVRTEFDIPFWLSEARAVKNKVLELTCGTGRVSLPLLKAGIDLTCVDYAPRMLDRFQKKLEQHRLSCSLICQDIAELTLPGRYGLIFIPFHSFSELVTEEDRRKTLLRVRRHLAGNGIFICTLQNPALRTASMDGTSRPIGEFSLPHGESLVVKSRLTYDPSSQLAEGVQLYSRYASNGTLVDQRTLDMRFYLFRREEFEALARECGFTVDALYGDYDYGRFDETTSQFMIWKLR